MCIYCMHRRAFFPLLALDGIFLRNRSVTMRSMDGRKKMSPTSWRFATFLNYLAIDENSRRREKKIGKNAEQKEREANKINGSVSMMYVIWFVCLLKLKPIRYWKSVVGYHHNSFSSYLSDNTHTRRIDEVVKLQFHSSPPFDPFSVNAAAILLKNA